MDEDEDEDVEIERTIAEQTFTSILDIASTRLLKSLGEIGYMNKLYSQAEYEKLHHAQDSICKQLL